MKCSSAIVRKMEAANHRSPGEKGQEKSKNYSRFIYRISKQGSREPVICLPKEPDVILAIASEAARLSSYNKRKTITRREIEAAIKTIISSK